MTTETAGPPRLTVLLVEDHVDSRAMYAEYLRLAYTVLEAGDGVAALDLMAATTPDVMVTDLELPRMDGYTLVERMRADDRLRNVAVIALSGHSSAAHEARARAVGMDLVLLKPCIPDELERAVAAAARNRKEGR